MNEYLLIYLLFAHWICDFGLQTRWQAENKSKSIKALAAHVGTYTLAFSVFAVLWLGFSTNLLLFLAINCGLHFVIDFTTSKITRYFHQKELMHGFWLTIGFDQWLHISLVVLTLSLLA